MIKMAMVKILTSMAESIALIRMLILIPVLWMILLMESMMTVLV